MIKNCFNYVGSKDRIFPAVDKNLDKSKKVFVDLFCGSGVIGINEVNNYQKILMNDACWQLAETLKFFQGAAGDVVSNEIDSYIQKYELSKVNKEGFNKLRDYYNTTTNLRETFDPAAFYCLATHSFNYNINPHIFTSYYK